MLEEKQSLREFFLRQVRWWNLLFCLTLFLSITLSVIYVIFAPVFAYTTVFTEIALLVVCYISNLCHY